MTKKRQLTGVPNADVPNRKRAFERQGWTVEVVEESPGPGGTSTLNLAKEG